jgi:hypothetical protein
MVLQVPNMALYNEVTLLQPRKAWKNEPPASLSFQIRHWDPEKGLLSGGHRARTRSTWLLKEFSEQRRIEEPFKERNDRLIHLWRRDRREPKHDKDPGR